MSTLTEERNSAGHPVTSTQTFSRLKIGRLGYVLAGIILFSAVSYAGYHYLTGLQQLTTGKVDLSKVVLVEPIRGPLEISINGSGSLDTVNKETLNCDVRVGEVKITYLIPEGTQVKKGDVVCEFDNSAVVKELTEMKQALTEAEAKYVESQERLGMSQNQTKTDIAKAKLELKLAQLDLVKYVEGEFVQNSKKLNSEISLKEEDLARARESLAFTERMVKKGYMDQTDLESAYSTMKKSQVELDAKKEELRVLVDYDRPRKTAEFEHKAEENERELERVESKAAIALKKTQGEFESRKLGLDAAKNNVKFWEEQLEKCKLVAPSAGEVIYANDKARNWGDDRYAIRVGNSVYQASPVIRLPDMSQFKVDAKVHESLYSRLKLDLNAVVEVEAYPNKKFNGVVKKISSVPSDDSFWNPGKKYDVEIVLDKFDDPEIRLRPSLSCKFTMQSTRLENVIQLPLQAVVNVNKKYYAWVINEEKQVSRRELLIGEANDVHLEIKDGISMGEKVVLNPRSTFGEEISLLEPKDKEKEAESEVPKVSPSMPAR